MSKAFTVETGKRYRAVISLGWFERMAVSNSDIASRLQAAGFVDVTVTGSGDERIAVGRWPGATTTSELDDHIDSVVEIP